MKVSIISLLLMGSGAVIVALKTECPTDEKLTCSCTDIYGLSIFCKGDHILSDEDLKSNLEAMQGYDVQSLSLKDITLNKAEVDSFEGQQINRISLDNVNVLDDSFKEGLEFFKGVENTLKSLIIQNCYTQGKPLKYFKLSHLQTLYHLMMQNNKIEEVGNDWFPEGPNTLQTISLMGNGINKLGDRAFKSLMGLKSLWITDNPLTEITRDMFPQHPNIAEITLSRNKITHFPTDIFHGMPNLQIVHLEDNLITTLDEHIEPTGLEQIVKFFLTGNPIICDQNIKWLCDERRANIDYFTCNSPEDKKGKIFRSFCDMEN